MTGSVARHQPPGTSPRTTRWVATVLGMALVTMLAACSTDPPTQITLGGNAEMRASAGIDMYIAPVEFVLADGVDSPGGKADAWRWDAVTADNVAALAQRLDVPGTPVQLPPEEGGSWQVGEPLTSTTQPRSATLNVDMGGLWWAQSGDDGLTVSRCAQGPDDPVSDDSPGCDLDAPVPPPMLPTDDEMLATASAVFGDDVTLAVEWRDEWSVAVRADYLVDGAASGHRGYYSVSGNGWYANGLLGRPVRQGTYDTVSAAEAVPRLTDGPLGMKLDAYIPVTDGPLTSGSDPGEPGFQPGVIEPGVIEPGVIEPGFNPESMMDEMVVEPPYGGEPMPEPPGTPIEPEQVVLVAVTGALVPLTDGDGMVWSLPGYRFTSADGGEWEVIAVADEYFDTQTPDPPGGDLTPPGGELPPGDGTDGDDGLPKPPPGIDDLPDVIGLTEADATAALTDAGYTVRVVERDGEMFPVTMDYSESRANLVITDGSVTAVSIG